MAGSGVAAWKWQANSYERQLATQAEVHQREREQAAVAVIEWQERQQVERRALETRLQVNDETHYKELRDAQTNQARLRDRLATADLRLSVLVDADESACGCPVPTGSGAGGVVHGRTRARLDPAAAQRIIAIAGDGDQGLIALRACQAYAREISTLKR
ncbi:lysis system i-spanin subunit Rz [Pseudomonas sp. QD4]|uniref:lysis system i-spanin subunit Rz n=1 Tax=Pseudomonas sp. QD4 TaxID=3368618 RepID=UPI003B9FC805